MNEPSRPNRRVTIRDIAERAGVSKGAVSLALNGRPGVSDETRARILAIVDELGWSPNRAARSLSAARADACGLVLARPAEIIALETYFVELTTGIEAELADRSVALTIQLVRDLDQEIAVYRRWWGERRVDGVLMVDIRVEDPRIDELVRLGMPAIVVGGPVEGKTLPSVWHNETNTVKEIAGYLAGLGHRRIARVAGVQEFSHTHVRATAFSSITSELGLEAQTEQTDFAPESGVRATHSLLSQANPPTAIVYDSDLLAVTGLRAVQEMGLMVPDDVSIVAWDDSLMCSIVHPPLTAMTRDIPQEGAIAAGRLLALIDGDPPEDLEIASAVLTPRASTGPARISART
jgi:DNA-binding LacI/PurR family transcriptional regulator